MGLFQALLLAASLGWTAVLAEPSDSAYAHSSSIPTWTFTTADPLEPTRPRTLFPHTESTAPHLDVPSLHVPELGSMTIYSPVTQETATSLDVPPTYASPVTMITGTSLDSPGEHTRTFKMPITQPTASSLDVPKHELSQHGGGSPTNGGGSPAGEAIGSTAGAAGETYFIHGSAIVAGGAPTVIAGTTYSIARTGGRVWVDGTATSAKDIVSTPAPLGSIGSGSGNTPAAATGAAGSMMAPGLAIGAVFGLVALL